MLVAKHKAFYFRSNAAKYDEAKCGTLKIIPHGELLEAFREDYDKMRSMFLGDVITFLTIIEELKAMGETLNG